MGRHWYEDEGKYLTKRNTFTDFCDAAKELIDRGVTTGEMMATEGASAGGLLLHAVLRGRHAVLVGGRSRPRDGGQRR